MSTDDRGKPKQRMEAKAEVAGRPSVSSADEEPPQAKKMRKEESGSEAESEDSAVKRKRKKEKKKKKHKKHKKHRKHKKHKKNSDSEDEQQSSQEEEEKEGEGLGAGDTNLDELEQVLREKALRSLKEAKQLLEDD